MAISTPRPGVPTPSTNNNAKKSPADWNGPLDARKMKGAGKYPNYSEKRTRSGHVFIFDDSNGAESITLQHRTGSMIQMMPDGAVQIVSNNGQYNLIFGENRIMVTGAQDITVQGTGSLRVEGDYNMTVGGNMQTTVEGGFNVTAKSFNATIGENIDFVGSNMTTKMSGNMMMTAHGNMLVASDGDAGFGSTSGSFAIGAGKDVGLNAVGGTMYMESMGGMHLNTQGPGAFQSTGKISVKASTVALEGPSGIHLNTAGQAENADQASAKIDLNEAKSTPKQSNKTGDKAAYVINT